MMRRAFTVFLLVAAVVGAAIPAAAQQGLVVKIREAGLEPDGETQLIVSVTGDAAGQTLGAANFTVTEEGQAVTDLDVKPLSQTTVRPVVVDLVMDVSGSTAGDPIANAKNAATTFVRQLPAGVRVGVVAFGDRATERSGFTADKNAVARSIAGLQAAGSTALYDAIVLSARRLGRVDAQRNMVVFSDGKDTVNRATLAQATAGARDVKAPVTTVGLRTADFDPASLDAIAKATGGRVLSVNRAAGLAGAFQQVAKEIASQYVITYTSTRTEPRELNLAVAVNVGSVSQSDTILVLNSRVAPQAPGQGGAPEPPGAPKPLIGAFASTTGLYVGVGAVFLAVLLFVGMILWRPGGGRAVKVLERGLKLYTRGEKRKKSEPQTGLSSTALGRRAVELVERVPKSQALEQHLQLLLDRAGWPLRATEFIVFQIMGVIVGAILGFGLFGRWWMGLVLMVTGFIVPRLVLVQQVNRRSSMFLSQLPDTLQLLSGSLQAGYAFMQAIDTIVREAPAPTSTEFSRVLSEARLGMPIEDALSTMADRVGSEDFRWVVLAINIQRQVGGNLATLLQTVANTLREREAVRRQIKVLSAEGRLSAVILIALPFVLFGYISLANPSYLQSLTEATIGKIMIAVALALIGVGAVWMRKIIKIDV